MPPIRVPADAMRSPAETQDNQPIRLPRWIRMTRKVYEFLNFRKRRAASDEMGA